MGPLWSSPCEPDVNATGGRVNKTSMDGASLVCVR
jgi:hypothetical protein